MSNNPLISIIIPVYNGEKHLRQSLDSAVCQTLEDIEIICVNDGSTDDTGSILKEYEQKDNRIRIINNKKNSGTLMARKAGVLEASGKYTTFLDADDRLKEDACAVIYEEAEARDTDILWFPYVIYETDENGRAEVLPVDYPTIDEPLKGNREIMEFCFIKHDPNVDSLIGKLYKTSLLKQAHAAMEDFFSIYGEDLYEFFFIAYYADSMAGYKCEPLYDYHRGRGISGIGSASLEELETVCRMSTLTDRINNFLCKEGAYDEYCKYLSALRDRLLHDSCDFCGRRVSADKYDDAVKILNSYWNEEGDTPKIIYNLLVRLREYNDWCRNLKEGNNWLREEIKGKNARIRDLESWTDEQEKAKEWFLEQIQTRDELIADLKSGKNDNMLDFCKEKVRSSFSRFAGKFRKLSSNDDKMRASGHNYDHIISLGYNCEVSFRIENYTNTGIDSYPLSWAYVKDQNDMVYILDNLDLLTKDTNYEFVKSSGMFHSSLLDVFVHSKIDKKNVNDFDDLQLSVFNENASEEIRSRFTHLCSKWEELLKGESSSLFIMKLQRWIGEESCLSVAQDVDDWLQQNYSSGKYLLACCTDDDKIFSYINGSVKQDMHPNLRIVKIDRFADDGNTQYGGAIDSWMSEIGKLDGR